MEDEHESKLYPNQNEVRKKNTTRNVEHFRGRKKIVNFSKAKICVNLAPAHSLLSHIRCKTSLLL